MFQWAAGLLPEERYVSLRSMLPASIRMGAVAMHKVGAHEPSNTAFSVTGGVLTGVLAALTVQAAQDLQANAQLTRAEIESEQKKMQTIPVPEPGSGFVSDGRAKVRAPASPEKPVNGVGST